MESFFNFKNFKNPKKVIESSFDIKNFNTVMVSFYSIKNFKSRKKVLKTSIRKAVVEFLSEFYKI